MKKEKRDFKTLHYGYGFCAICNIPLKEMGALLYDKSGSVCDKCDQEVMINPRLENWQTGKGEIK